MMNSFATAISIALQYGVPLETLVQKFTYMRFEPEGITQNPEIPFAKSMPDYIMRWLASRFLDADTQEELGILTPEVRARKTAAGRGDVGRPSDTAGPATRPRPAAATAATRRRRRRAGRRGADRHAAGRPGRIVGPRPRPGLQPVRRHDAAHGLLLHVLELRQQHRLRLSPPPRRVGPGAAARRLSGVAGSRRSPGRRGWRSGGSVSPPPRDARTLARDVLRRGTQSLPANGATVLRGARAVPLGRPTPPARAPRAACAARPRGWPSRPRPRARPSRRGSRRSRRGRRARPSALGPSA